LLEYTKSKPKQELEVTSQDTDDLSDMKLLAEFIKGFDRKQLAVHFGIQPGTIEKLLGGKSDS